MVGITGIVNVVILTGESFCKAPLSKMIGMIIFSRDFLTKLQQSKSGSSENHSTSYGRKGTTNKLFTQVLVKG